MAELSQSPVNLDAQPKEGQLVTHEGTTYNTIKEGLAYILVPPNARTSTDPQAKNNKDKDDTEQAQSVFYNPIQQFNRDLSVLAIKAFGEDSKEKLEQRAQLNKKKNERKKNRQENQETDGQNGAKRRKGNDGSVIATGNSSESATENVAANAQPAESTASEAQSQQDATVPSSNENGPEGVAQNGRTETKVNDTQEQAAPRQPKFRILDALSASGLRALRYAHEIPFASSITANDMSPAAVESIALNVAYNKLSLKIVPSAANAIAHMYTAAFAQPGQLPATDPAAPGKYDVIDLDPYGTAVPFLDAAVQSISDGGLLCVTCTDAGVFASCGYLEKTYSLYGGLPIKGPHSHEAGLRLILHSIATTAAKYGVAIEPLLSLSIDFYARVFVRVRKSPAEVKFLAGKIMLVHQCDHGCGAWSFETLARNLEQKGKKDTMYYKHVAGQGTVDQLCTHCGFKTHVAGPMWAGPIHNPWFIERILKGLKDLDKSTYGTTERIEGMLTSALDELEVITAFDGSKSKGEKAETIPSVDAHVTDPHPFSSFLRRSQKSFTARRLRRQRSRVLFAMLDTVLHAVILSPGPSRRTLRGMLSGQSCANGQDEEKGSRRSYRSGGGRSSKRGEGEEKGNAEEESAKNKDGLPSLKKVVFDEVLGKDKLGKRLLRYQINPRDNWGPMSRAKGRE
ncbi:RNA methyltransferase tRNA(m5U54)methyltransferase [Taxawa tesnikishii (nom. ined.)]|nr:RNA methyltransferase tRNA(m5U54)methyltransferase [Dothideales sp. JES 119]